MFPPGVPCRGARGVDKRRRLWQKPVTTRIVWKGRGAESTLLSTFRQDFSPPYAVSREAAPWSQLPRSPPLPSPPLPSRPTVLTLVPNFHDPHSANSMKPVLDEQWPYWPAGHLLQDRGQSAPRSSHLKAQPIHLNQHLNQPWSESAKSASYAQLSTTRNRKEDVHHRGRR